MDIKSFKDKAHEISVTAGMNQRYHQEEAKIWWLCDLTAKVVTASFAVAGFSFSIASLWETENGIAVTSCVLAALAAIAAIILNVVPFGAWERDSTSFFRQWTDLREDADSLEYNIRAGKPPAFAIDTLRRLEGKLHRLCGTESQRNRKRWKRAQEEENKSREPAPLATPKSKTESVPAGT